MKADTISFRRPAEDEREVRKSKIAVDGSFYWSRCSVQMKRNNGERGRLNIEGGHTKFFIRHNLSMVGEK